MGEFLVGIFALGIGLLIWAAVGHLVWVVLAAIARGLFGSRCDTCGHKHFDAVSCPKCRMRIQAAGGQAAKPSVEQDFEAARRLLAYSKYHRWISEDQQAALGGLLDRLGKRIRAGDASPPPPATTAPHPQSAINQIAAEQRSGSKPTSDPLRKPLLAPETRVPPPAESAAQTTRKSALQPALEPPALASQAQPESPTIAAQLIEPIPAPVHPLDASYEPPPALAPRAPVQQRVAADIMRSFMEQSNIRWVELISGVLIVVCSVGLVISLWSTLSSTSRFFPSLVFLLATLAVHGAGQYTLKQWKLRTTSRGILHIGLMLIPLSVLVGILLTRRADGPPPLDVSTLAVIVGGTLIYGALAVTASRSLFGRRWRTVAAATIIGSLSLVPVFALGQQGSLGAPSAALVLLPLVGISLGAALLTSRGATRVAPMTESKARLLGGVVVQTIFAASVVFVFAVLQGRSAGSVTVWWWLMAGTTAAAWASWGWAISLSSFHPSTHSALSAGVDLFEKKPKARPDWIVILGFCLAAACGVFLVASMWQAAPHRGVLTTLLLTLAALWLAHGWLCNLRTTLIAGGLAAVGGLTLSADMLHAESMLTAPVDWLGFSRIMAMTIAGLALVAISSRLAGRTSDAPQSKLTPYGYRTATTRFVFQQLLIAGGIAVCIAGLLTVVASLVPLGATPYGGNWASTLLMLYGVIAIAGSLLFAGRETLPPLAVQALMPVGQAVLVLGTVRMFHSSPMLATLLGSLRPTHAWAVALALIAPCWALLAAVVRSVAIVADRSAIVTGASPGAAIAQGSTERSATSWHIDWLSGGAVLLAVVSALAIWSRSDELWLASRLGWTLPVTAAALFVSWRASAWREATLLTACAWSGAMLYGVGMQRDWWNALGLAPSTGLFVAVCTLLAVAFEGLLWRLRTATAKRPAAENVETAPQTQRDASWITAGHYWAADVVLFAAWSGLLLTILGPSGVQLSQNLGAKAIESIDSFAAGQLTASGAALLFAVSGVLTLACWWIGHLRSQWSLVAVVGVLPVFSGLVAAAWIGSPHALSTGLWVLAAWLLAGELLRFAGPSLATQSSRVWQQLLGAASQRAPEDYWLLIARILSFGLLILGSFAFLTVTWFGADATTATTLGSLLRVLGPLLVVSMIRWGICVWEAQQSEMLTAFGVLLAATLGCIASIAAIGSSRFPDSLIAGLQVTALSASLLAWCTILFAASRNMLGLRAIAPQATLRTLFPKSLKGARWKKSEAAGWSLGKAAMVVVSGLCIAAAALVVAYPVEPLRGLDRLGGWLAVGTFFVTVSLFWFLAARRGNSHFAILAGSLGLLAPIVAASYAVWLIADPSRVSIAAADFEPLRALNVLWLVALSIGLAVRIATTRRGDELSTMGEAAWIVLASVVAMLALVSTTHDPNPWWPCAELSTLALITVLSGAASGQAWRGHLAAVAAAAAFSGWLFQAGREFPEQIWILLWGPVWVAGVALAWRLVIPLRQSVEDLQGGEQGADALTAVRALRPAWRRRVATIDQSASLHVPIASVLLSFGWWVLQPSNVALPNDYTWWIVGLTIACLGLSVTRLWDPQPGKRGLSVYLNLLALAVVLTISLCSLGELPKLQTSLLWMASLLGAMAVMAGLLRELVRESSRLGPAFKLGAITGDPALYRHALHWMPAVHTSTAMLALVPCVLLVLVLEERTLRVAATALPLLGALAILPIAFERSKAIFRYAGLLLISVTLVLMWWADLPEAWSIAGPSGAWIYGQRVFAALITLALIYPCVASLLREHEYWERPLMHFGWLTLGLGIFGGCCLLVGQFAGTWAAEAVATNLGTKLMTIAAWTAVVARLLQFAAWPTSIDRLAGVPLRKAAVYAAEIGLALLCAAFYFHFPQLFSGILAAWWPIVVFAIAMVSAGIGQWLHRLEQPIIADPVRQSSLLLPLIPLAGVWWFAPQGAPFVWNDWGGYSLLLLTAAGLYGLQGWVRESVWLRAFSGGLVLASFWTFLHSHPDLRFFEHPQFWLLPPALASLLFVELNRARLEMSVVVATRYIAILVAYLSSTAEIFLKAFEGQLWQPLLLLVLALLGVAAGIVLRVRAFLYCGAAFTLVALVGMVWHAQQAIGQVWPWWAFGIATGVGLIVLLGYFEKNRPRVLAYLEHLKQWEV